jgi:hypothetical protein
MYGQYPSREKYLALKTIRYIHSYSIFEYVKKTTILTVIKVVKLIKIGLMGHVERVAELRNVHMFVFWKT